MGLISFGVALDSASFLLENHVCAPPLLKRIVVVGGAFLSVSEREAWEVMEDTKGGVVGDHEHRGGSCAHTPGPVGKGGRPREL